MSTRIMIAFGRSTGSNSADAWVIAGLCVLVAGSIWYWFSRKRR